jgi:hypothetical protein
MAEKRHGNYRTMTLGCELHSIKWQKWCTVNPDLLTKMPVILMAAETAHSVLTQAGLPRNASKHTQTYN